VRSTPKPCVCVQEPRSVNATSPELNFRHRPVLAVVVCRSLSLLPYMSSSSSPLSPRLFPFVVRAS
jgi:hypothetical protein